MKALDETRRKINEIDKEMARLFEQRMEAAKSIAETKAEYGLPVFDPVREREVIARNRAHIKSPELEEYYLLFQKNLMQISRSYQQKLLSGLRVAYCGTEGAYGQLAAEQLYPGAQTVAYPSFRAAYQATGNGECDITVLPMENSAAGFVESVAELLYEGELFINRVFCLPVRHCLLAKPDAKLEKIQTVVSHPQALKQCEGYLRRHGYSVKESTNTAIAAKELAENGNMETAVIASAETASRYGLRILEQNIADAIGNSTCFAAFSRNAHSEKAEAKRENERFALLFTVENRAGSLAQVLNVIGAHGYNMTEVWSHPLRGVDWSYFFYTEIAGSPETETGKAMLRELSAVCARLKLLGHYFIENIPEETEEEK